MRPRAKRFLQATKISASSGRIRWTRGSGSPGPGTQRPVGRTVGPWSLLGKAGFSAAGEGAAFALLCLLPCLDQRSGLLKAAWQTRRTGVKNAPTALEQRAWKTPPLSLKAEAVQRKHHAQIPWLWPTCYGWVSVPPSPGETAIGQQQRPGAPTGLLETETLGDLQVPRPHW